MNFWDLSDIFDPEGIDEIEDLAAQCFAEHEAEIERHYNERLQEVNVRIEEINRRHEEMRVNVEAAHDVEMRRIQEEYDQRITEINACFQATLNRPLKANHFTPTSVCWQKEGF